MSSQKGNTKRTRPQKYQNHHAFKNDLHDTSLKTKMLNSIQIVGVCERCTKILEWKIKYKKYKPLKAPSKCTKCDQKNVKRAYHIMCEECAKQRKACPKCGNEYIAPVEESSLKDQDEKARENVPRSGTNDKEEIAATRIPTKLASKIDLLKIEDKQNTVDDLENGDCSEGEDESDFSSVD